MLRLNDVTAVIQRTINLVQGNTDTCKCFFFRTPLVPTGVGNDYLTAFAEYNGIGTGIFMDNNNYYLFSGPPPFSSAAKAIPVNTLAHFGYRRSGTSHFFYVNGKLIGSYVDNVSAVTFVQLLLGNDTFGTAVAGNEIFDFAEWNASKSVGTIQAQMQSIGTPASLTNLVAFCPLVSDLNDISGNNNHFSGAGNYSFVSNPTFPSNYTPQTALSLAFGLTAATITQNVNISGFIARVFYKYTNSSGKDQVISLGHWGDLAGGYVATADIWADEALSINVGDDFPDGSNTLPIPNGETYWFDFFDNGDFLNPTSILNIKTIRGPEGLALAGDVFIRSASFSGGADIDQVLIGLHGGFVRSGLGKIGYVPQFPTGESGDIMPTSGNMVFADEGLSWEAPPPPNPSFSYWIYLVDKDFQIINKYAWESFTSPPGINRTHLPSERVYFTGNQSGNNKTYSYIGPDGIQGPVNTISGAAMAGNILSAIAVNNAETIMYMGASGKIRQWNLNTLSFDADLVAAVAGYSIIDLLVLPDSTIIAGYSKSSSVRDMFVRRYDSAGVLLNTYLSGVFTGLITSIAPRLGYSAQSDAFLVLNHLSTAFSDIRKIKTDGTTLSTTITPDVNQSSIAQANPPIPYISDSCPIIELRINQVVVGGSIIVAKVTNPTTVTDEFSITAGGGLVPGSFTLKNGQSRLYDSLSPGIYSIIETPKSGFSTTYSVSDGSPNNALNLSEGETITVTITNTITQKSSSGIYKIVPGKRQDTLWLQNFTGTRDVKIP